MSRTPIYRDARDARQSAAVVANRTGHPQAVLLDTVSGDLAIVRVYGSEMMPLRGYRVLFTAHPEFA